MKLKEPTCHAERINDEFFNATGALSTIAVDVRALANAMLALGLSSGEDLYRMGEEISNHARAAAQAHSEHINRQSEGTLYSSISSTHHRDASK